MPDLIPANRLDRIPDQDWLLMASPEWETRITGRLTRNGRRSVMLNGRLVEQTFAEAVKSNPSRFVKLARRLPADSKPHWLASALEAAARTTPDGNRAATDWAVAAASDIEALLSQTKLLDSGDVSRALARIARERPDESWSEATIDRICDLAVNHPDPLHGEFVFRDGNGSASAESVFQTAFNCTRGAAVLALTSLYWRQPNQRERLREVAQDVARDPHPSVRAVAIGLAGAMLNEHPGLAISLVEWACKPDDPRVLHSPALRQLLPYLWWRCDSRVEAIIERMTESGIDDVIADGAQLATWIASRKDRMRDVADRCAEGAPAQRQGVARALVNLIDPDSESPQIVERLTRYFNDENAIAEEAARVFGDEKVMRSSLGPRLAASFVDSEHFARQPDDLTRELAEFTGDLKPYRGVLERILQRATGDLFGVNSSFRHRGGNFAEKACECVLRLYRSAQTPEHTTTRAWCLNQLDIWVARGDSYGRQALGYLDADS